MANIGSMPLILDNGTGNSKNGFAGEDQPRSVFPTLIGYPKNYSIIAQAGGETQEHFIGAKALQMKGVLKLVFPIEHGIIDDWKAMTKIWSHTFYQELGVDPRDHPVMLTEAPLNPRPNREKMLEIMFEEFCVPAIYVAMQAVLSLYASGRTTGVVIDIGDGVAHIVPIYEGFALTHAISRLDLAGRDITKYLQRLLSQKGYRFSTSAEQEIVRVIKEELCYVAPDLEKELNLFKKGTCTEKTFMLPDGDKLCIGEEMCLAPECLFNPSSVGKELEPLHELILNCIKKCDIDLRRDLYTNIVLSGGSTMFPGLKQRLTNEIKKNVPESVDVKIIAPYERMYSVWVGGSILASLEGFNMSWISHKEYREQGAQISHRCF